MHLKNICISTRGIIFLGTPHSGAALAQWAKRLAKSVGIFKQTNSHMLAVLDRESEVLARIQDQFHAMIRCRSDDGYESIQITCFYEQLPMLGTGIVS